MACKQNDLLDADIIQENLNTGRIGRNIVIYNSTSSTNDIAQRYAKDTDNDGLAIFAEEQTSGRGRNSNIWISKRSDSILCSILLIDFKVYTELLSLASAVGVAEAITNSARIKWPNDILINSKKIAGILLETRQTTDHLACIIGIGINCHQQAESFPGELRSIATSLDIESNAFTDRNILAKRLLQSMDYWLNTARKNKDEVIEQWQKLSIQLGHRISLLFNGKKFTGSCIGVDPDRGLILKLDLGGIRMFDAAHTTIEK